MFSSAYPVLPVLFCPSYSARPVLPVLFCLSCPTYIQMHEREITSAKIKERESATARNRGARKYEREQLRRAKSRMQKREI
jgi:hypothetical protein